MTFNPDAEADKVLRQADSLVIALECLAHEFVSELVIRPESISHALTRCNELRSRCDFIALELSHRLLNGNWETVSQSKRDTMSQTEVCKPDLHSNADLLDYVAAVQAADAALQQRYMIPAFPPSQITEGAA